MFDPNCGIYVITSPSGKRYVGQSVNIKRRWIRHRHDLKSGKHVNGKLQNTAKKYGVDSLVFEVWCNCAQDSLAEFEQAAYDEIRPELNIGCAGIAPLLGKKHSEKTKERLRQVNLGRKMSPDAVAKIKAARAKQIFSEEAILKRAASHRGAKRSSETIERIKAEMKRRSRDPVFLQKIANAQRNYWASLDAKTLAARMAVVHAGQKPAPIIPVRCVDTGQEFASLEEVQSVLGHDPFSVKRACRGVRKTAYGMRWEFV